MGFVNNFMVIFFILEYTANRYRKELSLYKPMTDKQNNRHRRILDIVTQEGRVEVARLAELIKVSRVTIRKDVDLLGGKGLVRHEHGLVLPGSSDDINNRLSYHYDRKQRIAQVAATLVQEGDTVMIESGSCCAILADELAQHKRGVTIITNSAFIAGYIRKIPQARIILLGGDYQNEAQVMVGPIARQSVQGFSVDKFFIGADGFSEKSGFTGKNHLRAETVRDMAKQALQVIVLTESEKFFKHGVVSLLPISNVSILITDSSIPPEIERSLTEAGTRIIKTRDF
jgi:DeoR/GlpR family transcriptional regulator of sugar metabolism